jgi:CRP/FNR family transcriptional regulator, cyclic AMP receptor protein
LRLERHRPLTRLKHPLNHIAHLLGPIWNTPGRVVRMTSFGPGDFFGEMTLIEMQNRSVTVVAESPTVLYELTARNLYTYYKADIYAYVR